MKRALAVLLLVLASAAHAETGTVVYIDDTVIEKSDRLSKIHKMTPGVTLGALTAYLLPQFNAISRIGIGTGAGLISGYAINEVVDHYKSDEIIPAYTITIQTNERIVCVVQEDLDGIKIGSKVNIIGDKIHGRF